MISLKITDIDTFSLKELSQELSGQELITYEFLPVKDKNGNILACDSQMGDIAIYVLNSLADQSVGLSLGLLVNWLQAQIEKNNVGIFFSIGTQRIGKKALTEEDLRRIIQEELQKIKDDNEKSK